MRKAFTVAHRGLSIEFPENSLAAFDGAIDVGFQAIEMDLRATRDGEVVVLHDAGLERTTTGHGRVHDIKYDELRTYSTGGGPVPRLDDLLGQHKKWQGHWDLEIKDKRATLTTLGLVSHHGMASKAHVSSMDPGILRVVHEKHPEIARGLIVLGPPDLDDLHEARTAGATWIHADHTYLNENVVEMIQAQELHLSSWTVNDAARALALVDMGVEAIITDTADVLRAMNKAGHAGAPTMALPS